MVTNEAAIVCETGKFRLSTTFTVPERVELVGAIASTAKVKSVAGSPNGEATAFWTSASGGGSVEGAESAVVGSAGARSSTSAGAAVYAADSPQK